MSGVSEEDSPRNERRGRYPLGVESRGLCGAACLSGCAEPELPLHGRVVDIPPQVNQTSARVPHALAHIPVLEARAHAEIGRKLDSAEKFEP